MEWTKRTTTVVAGSLGAGVIAWWVIGSKEEGGVLGRLRQVINDAVNSLVQRGARLTSCPYDTATGVVPCDPQALADQAANGDLEALALAKAIASEEGRGTPATQLAVGWAIRNRANASSGSVATLVLRAKEPTHSGRFGTQRNIDAGTAGYNGSDRYCSTALDVYQGHLDIALGIQTGELPDPTGGAEYFDRAASDDNAAQVAANRAASGLALRSVPGADPGLRFWGPATG